MMLPWGLSVFLAGLAVLRFLPDVLFEPVFAVLFAVAPLAADSSFLGLPLLFGAGIYDFLSVNL